MGAVPGTFSRRKESQAPGPREIRVTAGGSGVPFAVAVSAVQPLPGQRLEAAGEHELLCRGADG
jgi:hypothetical protein